MRHVSYATLIAAILLLAACSNPLEAPVNLAEVEKPDTVKMDNVSIPETDGTAHWRWFLGPESRVSFKLPKNQRVEFEMYAFSQIAGQSLRILVNGKELGQMTTPKVGGYHFGFGIDGMKGDNKMVFQFSDWNHGKTTFAANDPRPMAMAFYRFQITPK
jgi:hypothetical protein